ncbi:MAG: HNH endonuclease [Candidatus Helarchaeota archaeon]
MPPSAVRTIKDLIYWQYAKIIAESAGFGKKNYGFVMRKYKQLQAGEITWKMLREYTIERNKTKECIFCGSISDLTMEHLLPRCFNGPDNEKNIVWICKTCNSSKGNKRLYEFWTYKKGFNAAKYEVPRIAEGKYLKLVYETCDNKNFLDLDEDQIKHEICPNCDLTPVCIKERSKGKLSPLCLDGVLTICFKKN